MNMKVKFVALVISLIFLSNTIQQHAYAAGYLTPLTSGVEVDGYFMHETGAVTVFVSVALTNPDGCSNMSRLHIKTSTSGLENMVAAVMTAHASGRTVGFFANGCETLAFWGGATQSPIITNVWVVN